MSLRQRFDDDLKIAMKARDQLRMDVIRMVKAAILNKEIELKKDIDDADLSRIMTTLLKQRRESVQLFQQGNRNDLADKELKEIAILEAYLPKALSTDELTTIVVATIQEIGATTPKEMGLVMKAVMAKLVGQTVDGKILSELVKAKLQ
jgi:uncharacterized protein YqeY